MFVESDDEDSSLAGKFGVCDTADECYACTERVILNYELNQLELPPESLIEEDEQIKLCVSCLHSMAGPVEDCSIEEVFDWVPYYITPLYNECWYRWN